MIFHAFEINTRFVDKQNEPNQPCEPNKVSPVLGYSGSLFIASSVSRQPARKSTVLGGGPMDLGAWNNRRLVVRCAIWTRAVPRGTFMRCVMIMYRQYFIIRGSEEFCKSYPSAIVTNPKSQSDLGTLQLGARKIWAARWDLLCAV
eukprot:COSAG02_NODE_17701_length_986_cov_1.355130_1_plen_145_part_10